MITIKNQVNNEYNIRASEIKGGRAYVNQNGIIYIGNGISHPSSRIKAFSIDGCCIVWENYNEMFKEVDIEVIVKGDTVV